MHSHKGYIAGIHMKIYYKNKAHIIMEVDVF